MQKFITELTAVSNWGSVASGSLMRKSTDCLPEGPTWKMAERRGDRSQYIDGMVDVVSLLRGSKEPTIVHTDQGSVYASMAYNDLIKDENIQRSMSRAGTPTDNPVNESLNGWIKEELFMDFHLDDCRSREAIRDTIDRYVNFYNKQRPRYAIGYDTPNHYYQRYQRGELERKDTFSKRILTTEPKFVQKRRHQKLKEKHVFYFCVCSVRV